MTYHIGRLATRLVSCGMFYGYHVGFLKPLSSGIVLSYVAMNTFKSCYAYLLAVVDIYV